MPKTLLVSATSYRASFHAPTVEKTSSNPNVRPLALLGNGCGPELVSVPLSSAESWRSFSIADVELVGVELLDVELVDVNLVDVGVVSDDEVATELDEVGRDDVVLVADEAVANEDAIEPIGVPDWPEHPVTSIIAADRTAIARPGSDLASRGRPPTRAERRVDKAIIIAPHSRTAPCATSGEWAQPSPHGVDITPIRVIGSGA